MVFAAAAAVGAACSRAPEMDDDMKRDLQAASAGSIELAPQGQAVRTVSALEQNRPATPKVAPVRQVRAPARTPPTQQVQNDPIAPAPVSTPKVQPPPPGGYKTMNDVIRNAPFPIKPARSKEEGAKRP
jgi:hypothetical protein